MAIGKTARATKPAATSTAAIATANEGGVTSVHISRGFTVSKGDFEGIKISVGVTASTAEEASAMVEELLAEEAIKANVQFDTLTGREPGDEDAAEGAEDAEDAEGAEGDDEAGLTPEDVNAMKRDELVALITENELDVDASKFPKNAKGLTGLREAVIEAAFAEGDEDGAEDAEDDTTDDDATGDEVEITADDINEMDRPTLVALIKDNGLDVDPKKHPKLSALRAAVIEVAVSEDDEEAVADDAEGYTTESLSAMGIPDLKAIYAEWELGDFPKGPPAKQKPLAIKAILAAQG